MKFEIKAVIKHMPAFLDSVPFETFTETVEAENFDSAEKRAKIVVWDRCKELEQERGSNYGYDINNVRVEAIRQDNPVTRLSAEQIVEVIRVNLKHATALEHNASIKYSKSQAQGEVERSLAHDELQNCKGRVSALEWLLDDIIPHYREKRLEK